MLIKNFIEKPANKIIRDILATMDETIYKIIL
jgi:hypothetical protein